MVTLLAFKKKIRQRLGDCNQSQKFIFHDLWQMYLNYFYYTVFTKQYKQTLELSLE